MNKIIFYDEDTMNCFDVIQLEMSCNRESDECYNPRVSVAGAIVNGDCDFEINKKPIELDPTTMKRIAKYNTEIEIKKLNKDKKRLQAEIKEIKKISNQEIERLRQIKEFISEFIESDALDINEFAKNKFGINENEWYD